MDQTITETGVVVMMMMMIQKLIKNRCLIIIIMTALLCSIPVTKTIGIDTKIEIKTGSFTTFHTSQELPQYNLYSLDNNSGLESDWANLTLTLDGQNITYSPYSSDIEKTIATECGSGYLLENDSFVNRLASLKHQHMVWAGVGPYNLTPYDLNGSSLNGTLTNGSQLFHQIDSYFFFNSTMFIQLVIHSTKSVSNANETNYKIHDIKTFRISEANATQQIATHIDILESVLELAPQHSVNLTVPEEVDPQRRIRLGYPCLVGELYTLPNFSGYGGLEYLEDLEYVRDGVPVWKIAYKAPFFNESLFRKVHWSIWTDNWSIDNRTDYPGRFGLNYCAFHFTLDGQLFAITRGIGIPGASPQPMPLRELFFFTTGALALLGVIVLFSKRRKML